MRFSWAIAVLFGVGLGLPACGSGYSTAEAEQVCDLEQAKPCQDETTRQQCVTCYEECGPNCAVLESCPVQYACPVD